MGLPDIVFAGLTPFTARLDGAWRPNRDGGHYTQREWRGSLRADRAFVGITLVRRENTLSWCRTPWPAAAEHEVGFIWSSYGPSRQYFNAYFAIGSAIVQTHVEAPNADAIAVEIAVGIVSGGTIQPLVRLANETRVAFGAWLIAAEDARSARNHTWHLRRVSPAGSDDRATRIFGGRRNGSMVLA